MSRAANPRKHALWRKRLQRFNGSKLSVAEFCRREKISAPSFYQWRRKLEDAGSNSNPSNKMTRPNFVPVEVTAHADLQVTFPNGTQLALPGSNPELVEMAIKSIAKARTSRGDA